MSYRCLHFSNYSCHLEDGFVCLAVVFLNVCAHGVQQKIYQAEVESIFKQI